MVICAVFGCNSNNGKHLKRNQGEHREKIKFHRFPKDEKLKKLWVAKCGRGDVFNLQTSSICTKHFSPIQIGRNLRYELLNYEPKAARILKPDAFPDINLPISTVNITPENIESYSDRYEDVINRHRQKAVEKLYNNDEQNEYDTIVEEIESESIGEEIEDFVEETEGVLCEPLISDESSSELKTLMEQLSSLSIENAKLKQINNNLKKDKVNLLKENLELNQNNSQLQQQTKMLKQKLEAIKSVFEHK